MLWSDVDKQNRRPLEMMHTVALISELIRSCGHCHVCPIHADRDKPSQRCKQHADRTANAADFLVLGISCYAGKISISEYCGY